MASLIALAAAIRERLLAEEPAPLPGFGTLRRVHLPARVENRPDGSKTLQPPRESLRLVLGATQDSDPLALALARQLGLPVAQGRAALKTHVDQLEALLSARGEVPLDGVGVVRRTDRGILFGADPSLLATINASFEGLTSVGTGQEASGVADEEPQEAAAPEAAAPEAAAPEAAAPEAAAPEAAAPEAAAPEAAAPEAAAPEAAAPEAAEDLTNESAPDTSDDVDAPSDTPAEPDASDAVIMPVAASLPFEVDIGPMGDEPYVFEAPEASGEADDTEVQDLVEAPTPEPDSLFSLPAHADLPADERAEVVPEASHDVPGDSNLDPDSAVDDLLAGIWETGTPVASDLLGSTIEDDDLISVEPVMASGDLGAQDLGARDLGVPPEADADDSAPEHIPVDSLFTTEVGPLSGTTPAPAAGPPPAPIAPRLPSLRPPLQRGHRFRLGHHLPLRSTGAPTPRRAWRLERQSSARMPPKRDGQRTRSLLHMPAHPSVARRSCRGFCWQASWL